MAVRACLFGALAGRVDVPAGDEHVRTEVVDNGAPSNGIVLPTGGESGLTFKKSKLAPESPGTTSVRSDCCELG